MNSFVFTTVSSGGLLRELRNEVGVSVAIEQPEGPVRENPNAAKFQAIWDTGATASVVSQRVVAACGLQQIGLKRVSGVHGTADVAAYLADLHLPNNVIVGSVEVTVGNFNDFDVLIGMDVIAQGDFAITHHQGRTKFSFCIPSHRDIDFVAEYREEMARAQKKPPDRARGKGRNKKGPYGGRRR